MLLWMYFSKRGDCNNQASMRRQKSRALHGVLRSFRETFAGYKFGATVTDRIGTAMVRLCDDHETLGLPKQTGGVEANQIQPHYSVSGQSFTAAMHGSLSESTAARKPPAAMQSWGGIHDQAFGPNQSWRIYVATTINVRSTNT